jgi:L-alanine-DL-glutamate epimerase-like enolase superfamily enzyme
MRIQSARVAHLRAPVGEAVRTSFGAMQDRRAVLLLVEDADGYTGVSESWANFPAWAPWERVAALERAMIPHLLGREVNGIPEFVSGLWRAFLGPSRQSGTVAPLLQALCAVELALWDLEAKRWKLPLSRLWFEAPLERVEVYASGLGSPLPFDLIDGMLHAGVRLVKLKLGFGDDSDRETLLALRRHLPHSVRIAVDVNRGWTFEQAVRWMPLLRDVEVEWVEEPLREEDEFRMAELSATGTAPLAAGENRLLPPGIDTEPSAIPGVRILQPDLTKYAPVHMALRWLPVARAGGCRVIPHMLGSAPGHAASLHFAAGCDDAMAEWDINANPLRTDLFSEPFHIVDGGIEIPREPGLGWSLREDWESVFRTD